MDIVRITHLPSPSPTTTTRQEPLTAELNAEWAALVSDPAVAAELAAEPIAGVRDLANLLAACCCHHEAGLDAADAMLAQVVAAGLEGRTLAVRVALQRVLGGLVRVAVRRAASSRDDRRGLFDELSATAWIVIASYPLARRPRFVAANITRDTEYLTCVQPSRLLQARLRADLLDEHDAPVGLRGGRHRHASEELDELVWSLTGSRDLEEADLALLAALASGASVPAIAEALGCTDRTVRNRRHRLVTKLRELSLAPI